MDEIAEKLAALITQSLANPIQLVMRCDEDEVAVAIDGGLTRHHNLERIELVVDILSVDGIALGEMKCRIGNLPLNSELREEIRRRNERLPSLA